MRDWLADPMHKPGIAVVISAALLIVGVLSGGTWADDQVRAQSGEWVTYTPVDTLHGEAVVGDIVANFLLLSVGLITLSSGLIMFLKSQKVWWLACGAFLFGGLILWRIGAVHALLGLGDWQASQLGGFRLNPMTNRREVYGWGAGLAILSVVIGLLASLFVPLNSFRNSRKVGVRSQPTFPGEAE